MVKATDGVPMLLDPSAPPRLEHDDVGMLVDSMLDGFQIVRAVRHEGSIVDFEWVHANPVAARLYHKAPDELVGRRMGSLLPTFAASSSFQEYVQVVETGEPLTRLRFAYNHDDVHGVFDSVAWRLGDGFAVTWRDVTVEEAAHTALEKSEELFRATVEQLPDAVSVFRSVRDTDGQIVDFTWAYANESAVQLTGHPRENLVGHRLLEVLPEHGPSGMLDTYRNLVETGDPYEQPTLWYEDEWGDGHRRRRAFDVRASKVDDGFVVITTEVTQLREHTESLVRANEEIQRLNDLGNYLQACRTLAEAYPIVGEACAGLFPAMSGMLSVQDPETGLLVPVAGWPEPGTLPAPFLSSDCWAMRTGRAHIGQGMSPRCVHANQVCATLCVPLLGPSGTVGALHLCAAPGTSSVDDGIRHLALNVSGSVAMALANLQLRAQLQELSVRDSLTGLYNRRYLEETLAQTIFRASRTDASFGVLQIDVDGFKSVNDTYGHPAGDALLAAVARLLSESVRPSDVACRYGGEEFTILLLDANQDVVTRRAELLRAKVEKLEARFAGEDLPRVTISCGIAMGSAASASASELLQAADAALYAAKRAGRNRVVIAERES